MRPALNIVLFQIAWWTCVLCAARGIDVLPPVVAIATLLAHFYLSRRGGDRAEPQRSLAIAVLGYAADSLLMQLQVLPFAESQRLGPLAPLWVLSLWVAFGTTLRVTFGFLKDRLLIAALLGAASGPLAYLGGEAMGAIALPYRGFSLTGLAIGWGALLPLLVWIFLRDARSAAAAPPGASNPTPSRATRGESSA